MAFDDADFEAKAKAFHDQMVATLLTGRMTAYNARLDGRDVIVVGFARTPDGVGDVVPLAVVITEDLFDHITPEAEGDFKVVKQ